MADLSDPRASQVVLIGSAQYTYLDDVPAVSSNLTGLVAVLADDKWWGLPAENCHLVDDAEDQRHVVRTVRHAAAAVGDDSLLLVYFAGHGLISYDGDLVLALPDTEAEYPHEAGLPYEWVRQAVMRSPARRRVVILDCCYAGRARGDMAGDTAGTGTDTVADKAEIDDTCLLVSAPRNRTAQAPAGATYTAFTGELLRVLREGLPDHGPLLDLEDIWRSVRKELQAKGYERPEMRARNSGGSIPLVRNAAIGDENLIGLVLTAAPHVTDPELARAAVLVLRHDPRRGALGVRISGPTEPLPADISAEWRRHLAEPMRLFRGGPVQQEDLIAVAMLQRGADQPVRFLQIRDRLGTVPLSADLETLAPALAGVRLFAGYVGWRPGALEADLAEGVLKRVSHQQDLALSSHPEKLWATLQRPAGAGRL